MATIRLKPAQAVLAKMNAENMPSSHHAAGTRSCSV